MLAVTKRSGATVTTLLAKSGDKRRPPRAIIRGVHVI
jgi:hypothetical protein